MDPVEFRNLRVLVTDLCHGLYEWDSSNTLHSHWLAEFTTLLTALRTGTWETEDEIISVTLSDLLHKLMLIACSGQGGRHFQTYCPAWPFVIAEIDAQLAKKARRDIKYDPDAEVLDIKDDPDAEVLDIKDDPDAPKKRKGDGGWWAPAWYAPTKNAE